MKHSFAIFVSADTCIYWYISKLIYAYTDPWTIINISNVVRKYTLLVIVQYLFLFPYSLTDHLTFTMSDQVSLQSILFDKDDELNSLFDISNDNG